MLPGDSYVVPFSVIPFDLCFFFKIPYGCIIRQMKKNSEGDYSFGECSLVPCSTKAGHSQNRTTLESPGRVVMLLGSVFKRCMSQSVPRRRLGGMKFCCPRLSALLEMK